MYFWLAKNIKCILPSRTSLPSSAAGRDRWIATSASSSIRRRSASHSGDRQECWGTIAGSRPCEGPATTFGDGDPDFARKRVGDGISGAQQVERGGLHAFDCRNNQRAFIGQAGAMDVTREQGGTDLPFKIIDEPANDVDGQFEPFRR